MYSQKHGKRQLSIGISFTNWFTQMFDDLLEPSHLLSGLQPIDLGRFHCMCHGPRLRSPKGCKSNMERYRKTPNGNDEPINFDINCAKPLGCGSLGYHFSKRFHYPWVYYSRDLGADDHRPNSSLWIQKLLYGWIRMEYDDSYIPCGYLT